MRDAVASAISITVAASTAGTERLPERLIMEHIPFLGDDLRAMGILHDCGTFLDRNPLDAGTATCLEDFFVAGNSGAYSSRRRFRATHRIKFPRVASSGPELTERWIRITEQHPPHQNSAGYRQPTTTTQKTKLHSIHSLPPQK